MCVSFYETFCRVWQGETAITTVSITAGSLIATVSQDAAPINNLS
jgi:hypothetical protein